MMKIRLFILHFYLAGAIILPSYTFAQACKEKQTPQTVSAGNFVFAETTNPLDGTPIGTAFHNFTNLTWNRCVYGQKWESVTQQCIGSPVLLTWQEALITASNMGWRLPNIKELNSIVDLQCINPPFDLSIFPNTYASEDNGLWTSSPHVDNPDTNKTNAWYITLGQGKLNFRPVDAKNFVRFVK